MCLVCYITAKIISSVVTQGFLIVTCQHHIRYNLFREQQQVGHLLKNFRRTPPMTNFFFLPFKELVDRIILNMDKKDTPAGIFLDVSKAFDTLDHDILLCKLKFYGFCSSALNLMESYLTGRQQFVQMDNTISDISTVKTGVPQCSILGSLLFIIYINDIDQASKIFVFFIYADDTSLTTTLEIILWENMSIESSIKNELINITDWLKLNKLTLNIPKTKFMAFHKAQRKMTPFQIKIEDTIIEQVSDFNFLGLTINQHLNSKSHVNKISNKIFWNVGILNKLKHILPVNTKVLIYNSLILSHINYGLVAWGYSVRE